MVLSYGTHIPTKKSIKLKTSTEKRADRFIKHDYKSRKEGCFINILSDLKLQPQRMKQHRLVIFYKVVEPERAGVGDRTKGLPYTKNIKNKKQIRAKQDDNFDSSKIVER